MGEIFAKEFNFTVKRFRIPSIKSHFALDRELATILERNEDTSSLLIVYYGGHGDPDEIEGKRRSVWAAYVAYRTASCLKDRLELKWLLYSKRSGGPTLDWFEIQSKFQYSDSDVLVLLDCCFAAQAARAREVPGRVELLAACAMGVKTPVPGPGSFTTALIKELRDVLNTVGRTTITELHRRLVSRNARLSQTAVYVELSDGSGRSICLQPFQEDSLSSNAQEAASLLTIQVSMRQDLTQACLPEIVRWLTNKAPGIVSGLAVEDILLKAENIQSFVYGQRSQPASSQIFRKLPQSAQQEVITALRHFDAEIARSKGISDSPAVTFSSGSTSRANSENDGHQFLELLNDRISVLSNNIGESILGLSGLGHRELLLEALQDETLKDLGYADMLRMRSIALFPSESGSVPEIESTAFVHLLHDQKSLSLITKVHPELGSVLVEFKYYIDLNSQGSERQVSDQCVQQLASLLNAFKTPDFCSLTCMRWFQQPSQNRYGLVFSVPEHHAGSPVTLQQIINDRKLSSVRPSLSQRFWIALKIGQALQKWHSVGWVHQNISSANIVFFRHEELPEMDYSAPYLCGFEFTRPSGEKWSSQDGEDFNCNFYQHPQHQGSSSKEHRKRNDLYSYGVLLYEIGRWRLAEHLFTERKKEKISPLAMSKYIAREAASSLCHSMGAHYANATTMCLRTDKLNIKEDEKAEQRLATAFKRKVLDELRAGLALGSCALESDKVGIGD